MDMKMQAFLDKVKDMADKTGKVSRHAAGVAGKKANDLALATRINLQIFDLNTECEALYKEIGKLVYDLHRGAGNAACVAQRGCYGRSAARSLPKDRRLSHASPDRP